MPSVRSDDTDKPVTQLVMKPVTVVRANGKIGAGTSTE